MMAAPASRSHFEGDYDLTAASNSVTSTPSDSATSLDLKMVEKTADPVKVQVRSYSKESDLSDIPARATCAASSQGGSHSGNETTLASPDPSDGAATSTCTCTCTCTSTSTKSVSLRKHPPSYPNANVSLNGTSTSTCTSTSTSTSTSSSTSTSTPPGAAGLKNPPPMQEPEPPRQQVSFATIPTALPAREDKGEEDEDLDKKPAARPTHDAVAGRATRGLSAGRRTAQDREARRQQIRERTGLGLESHQQPGDHGRPPTNIWAALEPPAAGRISPMPSPASLEPAAATEPTTPLAATLGTTALLRGDNIAEAPGDGLASMSQRLATRGRRPDLGVAKQRNPTADAYEAADHSLKQRLRRENYQNMPSSIRPGAYKEIPGRGLVRNDTLRFSIMTTIQKQKQSLRRIFGGSRQHGLAANHASSEELSYRQSMNNENHPSDHQRASFVAAMNESMTSVRTFKSFPSVLVEEDEDDRRSYLGNISMRSLELTSKEGLCVARPVFHKVVSTLEALCIIPGDLAVAVALDQEIRQQQNASSAHPSPRGQELKPSPRHGKRAKARRVAQFAKKWVQQHRPTLRTIKNLITFRKGTSKPKRESAHDRMMQDLKSARVRWEPNESRANATSGAAARRHSW